MRPFQIFTFLLTVGVLCLLCMLYFPEEGIKLNDNFTLTFASLDDFKDDEVEQNRDSYGHNAETVMEVGNALGWDMANLLEVVGDLVSHHHACKLVKDEDTERYLEALDEAFTAKGKDGHAQRTYASDVQLSTFWTCDTNIRPSLLNSDILDIGTFVKNQNRTLSRTSQSQICLYQHLK